jgi:hypothetical protein
MIYSRYLRSLLLGFLLASILFVSAVLFQIGAPIESSRWLYEIYIIKNQIAQSIKVPKLTIISGSNAIFGISCKTIQQQSNVPCFNGGTNGALGTDYLFKRARPWLKPGDIVLLPLEYEFYTYQKIPNDAYVSYVLARDPQYLRSVDLLTQFRFITGVSFERLKLGILAKLKTPALGNANYQSKNLNQYGDETSNLKDQRTKDQLTKISKEQPMAIINGTIDSSYGMNMIRDFTHWCRENNITVLATWPNTIKFEVYRGQSQQAFFQSIEQLYQKLGVPLLGKPEDFMYKKSLIYDTSYHLNDQGVKQRTQQIITLLKPYLENMPKI